MAGAALGLALGAVALGAQAAQTVRMANGLVVSVTTDSRARTLEVATTYFVGSRNDPDLLKGLAHMTEHIAMREVRGRNESIAVILSRLGVRAGAVTQDTQTVFTYEAEPGEAILSRIFEVEKLRATSLALLGAAVDAERRRIIAETGTRHRDLARITIGDVIRFHAEHYTAVNSSVSVRGPLPAATVIRLAEAVFGAATRREVAAAPVAVAPAGAARWVAPDTSALTWQRFGDGLQWLAAPGGDPDSVYFAAWVTVQADLPSARDVAALELFARTWSGLRLGGRSVADSLAAMGAHVEVTAAPYPPLATSDTFRELGTTLTPLGAFGLQILGAARRNSWTRAVALVGAAILDGQPNQSLVDAEIARQTKLLQDARAAALPQAEVAFRRSAPALPLRATGAWRPAPLDTQVVLMRSMTADDVRRMGEWLGRSATARVAVLGANPAAAATPLNTSGFGRLRGTPEPRDPQSCGSAGEERVVSTSHRSDVFFALCIPVAGDARTMATLQVVNAVLGGREDALLAERLRPTGLAYAFESRVLPTVDDHGVHWHLRVGTQTTSAGMVIDEVRKLLERVSAEGITAAQLSDYREWLAAQRLRRSSSGKQWTQTAAMFGTWPEAEATNIRAVTLAEVNAALKHWLPHRLAITAPRAP